MKLRCMLLLFSLGLLTTVNAEAGNLQSRFELMRSIDGTFHSGQRGRIVVPDDVFGQTRSFPNDLRIFASDGTQWPFFLYIPQEKGDAKVMGVEILNRSWVAGAEPYLQFDVAIPEVAGKPPVHNRLELVTTGRDFVRRVEIFTGDPALPAGHMASGYLIDFSKQRDARNQIVRYSDSDVARLHIRIYPNAQAADETFGIVSARLYHRATDEVEREPVGFRDADVDKREQQEGAQTRILDIGQPDRPVEFISFDVPDSSYARCVSVYGRNSEHEEWRWVGGGEIHALPADRSDTVKLHARSRFLKMEVFHYDDQPLAIEAIRLEAVPRYLIFEAATDGRVDLYFRAWDVDAPRYDLRGRIKDADIAGLPIFQTLETKPNASARVHPWWKYSKLLGGLAIAAVSLLVIWIIISMLRQQMPSGSGGRM